MGLFGKKELCPVCGKKIKGDVLIKIKDNVPLCRECSAAINMETMMIPYQTPESIRAHLDYRDRNQDKFDSFDSDLDLKAGSAVFCVDNTQKIWYCTTNKRDKNPPVFTYDEIADYQYTENGAPYVPEEKKGAFAKLFGEKKEPVMIHSMKLHIDLNNPYTHTIDIEMLSLDEEVKSNSFAYKSNKRAIDRVLDALDGMTGKTDFFADDSEEEENETYQAEPADSPMEQTQQAENTEESWQQADTAPSLEFGAPDEEETQS